MTLFEFLDPIGKRRKPRPEAKKLRTSRRAPVIARPKSSHSFIPLFDDPSRVMFLDIETTGLSKYYDYITLVGYELAGEYHVLLAGEDPSHFLSALDRTTSLVTFNGTGFDLPFLEMSFSGVRWPKHHVDLRYACRRIGLFGGQKNIEKELRITCRDGFEGVDGAMAVVLWHRYLRGDRDALRELIEYNRADVRAMAYILDHVAATAAPTDLLSRTSRLHAFCASPDLRRGIAAQQALLPAPPEHLKRPVTFLGLFAGTSAENATVVGLDLTGSAERPSGACVMIGSHAETRTLGSDEEILSYVLSAKPDLVALDSPLCLPVGRTRATDDDPNRHFGIMRQSERILKRRGINVYPCLIPSMQRLTQRGIDLAVAIRAHGIPVIECYPGAAQDIMGIPRKGAGKEWLALGMSEFGVQGAYESEEVTHDELDAITCSLVGFFHLAGRSEALCGKGEEPMIVPDYDVQDQLVVGISGEIFAGKTTAARFLEARGYAYTRISEVIDDVIRKRGVEPTRESRQQVGMELHETKGQRWLCRKAIERVSLESKRIVVDGLRWKDDVAYMRERFGGRFVHLHIDASESMRRLRAAQLGKTSEFDHAIAHPVERGIGDVEMVAENRIVNEQDIAALEAQLAERVVSPHQG